MEWAYLLMAGLFEVAWAIGLKYTDGWTKLGPSLWTGVMMFLSFALLSRALTVIPVGTGYAVWTGIGAAGTALLGMVLFGESRDVWRLMCLGFVLIGIIGLKLTSPV